LSVLLYESYQIGVRTPIDYRKQKHALAVTQQSYPIWDEKRLHFDLWDIGRKTSVALYVDYASLVSASLLVHVKAELWPCAVSVSMNGKEVGRRDFFTGGTWTDTFEVSKQLLKGSNEFVFGVFKEILIGWGDVIVSADLTIEGEEVEAKPPPFWEKWPTWWPYAAVAGVGTVVIGVALLSRRGGIR